MSTDKEHVALPKLYGAPAYGLRRMATVESSLPLCPDDLPIERHRSPEDQAVAAELLARSYGQQTTEAGSRPPRVIDVDADGHSHLRGAPLLLRAIAGRLVRPAGH